MLSASRFSHIIEKYRRILTGLDFATRLKSLQFSSVFRTGTGHFGNIWSHFHTLFHYIGIMGTDSAVEIIY